ncbi:Lon protease [Sulfidibacter corallicola]|uniref:Lon protease n=1 Tax=Sulfidibacter corallicola TaxID=2818388 RepID=A0A8A4TUX6_SULCO|nr:endopeptidase La [Sulfidibacter corallicola]QTD53766.1 endopeptidase La [Sulfidibacter corallicola]
MKSHPVVEAEKDMKIPEVLPVVAVRDTTLYPFIIFPFSVGRETGVAAVEAALNGHRMLVMLGQRDQNVDTPKTTDLFEMGTVASVMRMIKLPDGRLRILVQGISRCRVEYFTQEDPFREAKIQLLQDREPHEDKLKIEALMRNVKSQLERSASLGKPVSSEVLVMANGMEQAGRLADLVASNIEIKSQEGQAILDELDVFKRLTAVNEILTKEVALLEMQAQIHSQARGEMDRSQRDFYLRQQLKIIQSELGEGNEVQDDINNYRTKIKDLELPEDAREEIEKQLRRMENMSPDTAETGLIRTYLDWMTELPWGKYSEDHLELKRAKRYLDKEHYGLEEIKERILEFLSVRQLNPSLKTPILCFVGPPGVGKTSLGQSIAKALGRQFVRISLGGLRDEAEIRGHRKTYVGALPGRIIQGISQAGTMNPVFMLDEVDKIGQDFRGDPSAALLEVLDPEQNKSFRDHYLGVPFDLSHAMFILTANTLDTLQPAFRDRLEVIELGSYTLEEKVQIAMRHLVPKQTSEHGLNRKRIAFSKPVLQRVIGSYTREAGLRNLERLIAKVCRKVARKVAEGEDKLYRITKSNLTEYLGPIKIFPDFRLKRNQVGVVAGLAWTSVGGEVLFVEISRMPGKGNLVLTGQLGEVMQESAKLAMSLIRTRAEKYSIDTKTFSESDIHIHFPEGATPKDGPSAGITVATALLSCLTQREVRAEVAMTGELTLRGDVLPIGGLKEKVLAASRAQIKTVLFPKLNESDWQEIPEDIRKGLEFFAVSDIDEVFKVALV